MIKVVVLAKKRNDVTQQEFLRCWEEELGPLAAKLFPGLRRYVQVHPAQIPEDNAQTEVDAIAEMYFDDLESWQKAYNFLIVSDEGKVVRDVRDKFVESSTQVFFPGKEKVIKEQ